MPHDFRQAAAQIAARTGVLVVVVVAVVRAAIHSGASDHQIGTRPIIFDERVETFLHLGRPEPANPMLARVLEVVTREERPVGPQRPIFDRIRVLDSGLEEGRGVAYQGSDMLFIADAWDEIFKCQIERNADRAVKCARIERLSKMAVCPEGDCEPIEHGGLLLIGEQLVVADEHQRRLLVRSLAADRSQKLESLGKTVLGRVHDAASIAPGTIVVAESADGNDYRAADADRQKAPLRPGAVYTLSDTGVRDDVKAEFQDPVGVAYSARDKRLYVADISANAETWRYFDREPSGWTEKGILWTAPIRSPTERPRLQSIVIGVDRERSSEIIFAAGPDGLYLLDPAGVLLAKYMLSAPVSGLAWGDGGELFMTVGRRLCVLMTAARPADPPTEKWPPQ